mgnify:FL=1
MKAAAVILSPLGPVLLEETDGALTRLSFCGGSPYGKAPETPLLREAAAELAAYFAGNRRQFSLPLALPEGTPWERLVWKTLLAIPYGETRTYAQIAAMAGRPTACRAVGAANRKNPLAVVVPCHRVNGKDGALTGYAGGLWRKKALLKLEGAL